ncbi:hypothetical protein D3C73_854320 [compost metagenome]
MQRQEAHIVMQGLQGLGHHLDALGAVHLGRGRVDLGVQRGVAPLPPVEDAGGAGAAMHHLQQDRQRIDLRLVGPAVDGDVELAARALGVLQRTGPAGQGSLYADPRPHRRRRLAEFFLVHEHVVGTQQRQGEAVGIARLGQQRLRLGRVKRQACFLLGLVAGYGRRHQRARRARQAAHHALLQQVGRQGHVQGLAYTHVFQRILVGNVRPDELVAQVEAEVERAQFGGRQHLHVGSGAQAVQILQGRVFGEVDVARQQRGHARRR